MTVKVGLLEGNVTKSLTRFATPLIIGNILQQIYSITDTLIVGKWLGETALAAVGSTYTLTTFLYSIIIGMCMGSGGLISFYHGENDKEKTTRVVTCSFLMIACVSIGLEIGTLSFVQRILHLLMTPEQVFPMALSYTKIILVGMVFVFLYNYYAYVLRAFGNSKVPMYALAISTVLNVILDIWFVVVLKKGVEGAALATLIAQAIAGTGIAIYSLWKEPAARMKFTANLWDRVLARKILHMSFGASVQQSIMNFGILMIQGLVNSFGAATMAAFTVAVKIDTLAYMPAQEFANAFSLFVSKNFGAKKDERIQKGIKISFRISTIFCILVSIAVYIFAKPLMEVFLKQDAVQIVEIGVKYLRIEGACYVGIGLLFLFYAYFRGMNRPEVSVLLTVISLGTRVILAYTLSPIQEIGVFAIWAAIPIGWFLADLTGWHMMKSQMTKTRKMIIGERDDTKKNRRRT